MPLRRVLESEFIQRKANGEGYELFLPDHPKGFDHLDMDFIKTRLLFEDVAEIVAKLREATNQSLLLEGEPGSGKSHLRDDIAMGVCALNLIPSLSVSLHINGGKATGPEVIDRALIRLQSCGDDQKLVLLDNVDYLGYKGKHRTRQKAKLYAKAMQDFIEYIVCDEEFVVLGMAHDERWRQGRWSWGDEEIDEAARGALHTFIDTRRFAGRMTEYGLREILEERGVAEIDGVVARLIEDDRADFFHAKHLDFELYATDPNLAVEKIENVRRAMKKLDD